MSGLVIKGCEYDPIESKDVVYGDGFRPYANLLLQGATGGTQTVDTLEATLSALNGTDYTGQFFAAGQGFFNNIVQDNEAFSIFGNVDFEITDRLVLTLGANYTKDKKQIVTNSTSTDVFSNIDLVASGNTAIFAQGLATRAVRLNEAETRVAQRAARVDDDADVANRHRRLGHRLVVTNARERMTSQ